MTWSWGGRGVGAVVQRGGGEGVGAVVQRGGEGVVTWSQGGGGRG